VDNPTDQEPIVLALGGFSFLSAVAFVVALLVAVAGFAGVVSVSVPGGVFTLAVLFLWWLTTAIAANYFHTMSG